MGNRQLGECPIARSREGQPLTPAVIRIDSARHESGLYGPPDELDRRMVLQLQLFGHFADRWAGLPGVPPNCEQKLMLMRCEPFASGGFLREVLEDAQRIPEPGQGSIVAVGEHFLRLSRNTILL